MKSLFIILFVACFALAGCAEKSERNKLQDFYDEIEIGMSKEEVSEIISGPNPEGKAFKVEPGNLEMKSKDGKIKFVIKFVDDKVSSKSQKGLRD